MATLPPKRFLLGLVNNSHPAAANLADDSEFSKLIEQRR